MRMVSFVKMLVIVGVGAGATALVAAALAGHVPMNWMKAPNDSHGETGEEHAALGVKLVPDQPLTIEIPQDVRECLGICKRGDEAKGHEAKGKSGVDHSKAMDDNVATAVLPTQSQSLVMPGSTMLDPTRLMRIRARFAPARVVEIAPVTDVNASAAAGTTQFRELRPGDQVKKDDLLGVFFSVDVGNKKNDLIDAILQLKLDQQILDAAEKGARSGAVPEVFLLNARRNVEGDHNAISRAVSNLKTWDIPEADIEAVRKEAEEISKRKGKRDKDKEAMWPRVELRAPDDGTIVERNVVRGEMVVDNTVNLFQIAKVDRLAVIANCPEDDLPILHSLKPAERKWSVRTVGLTAASGLEGPIDEIGYLIDPNQHTAVIKGFIDNPNGLIRGGQFISATVRIPAPAGVVEVPMNAVIEDGQQAVVFVQTDAAKHQYKMRRVQLTHRFDRTAFVRSTPIPAEDALTPEEKEEGLLPREPLKLGEKVLLTGVGQLKLELYELQAKKQQEEKEQKEKRVASAR
jgi:cobalt-zinc-cadmium efflux system membrane fusion protein